MEHKREWDGYFNYEYDVQSVNNGIDIFEFSSIESEKRKMNVSFGNTFKKEEMNKNKINKSKSIFINDDNIFDDSFYEIQKLKNQLIKYQEENKIYIKKEIKFLKEINDKDKLIKELEEKIKKLQNLNLILSEDNKKLLELVHLFKILSELDKKNYIKNNDVKENNINKANEVINYNVKKIPNPKRFINISNNKENSIKTIKDKKERNYSIKKTNVYSKSKINSKSLTKEKNKETNFESNFNDSYLYQDKNYINYQNKTNKYSSRNTVLQNPKNLTYEPYPKFEKGIITISSCSNNNSGNDSLIYIENRTKDYSLLNSKYYSNTLPINESKYNNNCNIPINENNNINFLSEDIRVTNNNTFNSNDYKELIERLNKYKEGKLYNNNNRNINNINNDKIPFQFLTTEKLYRNILISQFGEI